MNDDEEDIIKVVTPMRSTQVPMRTSTPSNYNRRRFSRINSSRSNRSSTTSTKSNSSDGQQDICYNCEAPISPSSTPIDQVPTNNTTSSTSLSPFSPTNMTSFDYEYCERLLCGTCITNVPCSGPNCTLSNCIECAENGNGDVLYCTHCGKGYCMHDDNQWWTRGRECV